MSGGNKDLWRWAGTWMPRRAQNDVTGDSIHFILLAAAMLVALALSACLARRPAISAQAEPSGDLHAVVAQAGPVRLESRRPKGAEPWKTVVVRNAGPAIARQIVLWGLGGGDLLVAPKGRKDKEGPPFTPFSLLPGEELSLSASGTPRDRGSLISGLALWEMPEDENLVRAAVARTQKAEVQSGGILMTPGTGEAQVDFRLFAPMPLTAARVAWRTESGVSPQLWVSVDGKVWARLPLPQPRCDWEHPAEMTASVIGRRGFILRLIHARERGATPQGEPIEQTFAPPLLISGLRIELEMQAPGALRPWKTGANAFSLKFETKQDPRLEVSLLK